MSEKALLYLFRLTSRFRPIARAPAELSVKPVEKVKMTNLQEKRLPHLTYKRRSRVGRPFRYP